MTRRGIPWHVAVRADRKALLTALGVALGVAFAVVSFGVPAALQTIAVSPEGPLAHADALVTVPGADAFDARALGLDNVTLVLLANATDARGEPVPLVALEGADAPTLTASELRPGRLATPFAGPLVVNGTTLASVGGTTGDPRVPPERYLASPAVARAADARLAAPGAASYVLAHGLDPARADALRARGYGVSFVPGIEPFFQASVREISRDLLLIVAFTCTLVGLFAYEFLRSEAREKRAEIGLWRSVGMRARDVLALLLARSLAIVAVGIALGSALALLALVGAARATHQAVYSWQVRPLTLALLVAGFLAAGAVGAIVPALAATRAPIRDQLEASA